MAISRLPPEPGRWPLLIPLLALIYVPFIGGGPLTDDFVHFERLESTVSVRDVLAKPDVFRFYRPVTQASLRAEMAPHGTPPAVCRGTNILLHAAVILAAFALTRVLSRDAFAATIAALVFALTPKAHPIAALWISGRAEILMALFSFAAAIAWVLWARGGSGRWLPAAAAAYLFAVFSKETAFLLPVALMCVPNPRRSWRTRLSAVAMLVLVGAVAFVWRSSTGALTPFSGDEHYDLLTGAMRIARSLQNYSGRMIVAPLALVVLSVGVGALSDSLGRPPRPGSPIPILVLDGKLVAFCVVWMLVFLAPVLPIVARSELYLYLPVFGMCVLAATFAEPFLRALPAREFTAVMVVYVVALAGYQATRGFAMHEDMQFSAKLVAALRSDAELGARGGAITLVPADGETERFLRDSIGGYLYAVLHRAFPGGGVTGAVQYAGTTAPPEVRRVLCSYRDGRITLIHEGRDGSIRR